MIATRKNERYVIYVSICVRDPCDPIESLNCAIMQSVSVIFSTFFSLRK